MIRRSCVIVAVAFYILMGSYGHSVSRRPIADLNMPPISLGTFMGLSENDTNNRTRISDVVQAAIDCGYRSFDTAAVYGTEGEVGAGVRRKMKEGVVRREDVFLTTKLWNTQHGKDQVEPALRESLAQLGMDYVDLFLMHWPLALHEDNTISELDYLETWKAMEDAQRLGLTRTIGLSNFNQQQLERVLRESSIRPVVLQIEIHPGAAQFELVDFAQSQGLLVMGYSPLGSLVRRFGQKLPGPQINDPTLVQIAKKYGKSTPQIVLRWLVDRNIVPVTKTKSPTRLRENIDIFDFQLDEEEIRKINSFDNNTLFNLPSFWQNHKYYPFERTENPVSNPFIKSTPVM